MHQERQHAPTVAGSMIGGLLAAITLVVFPFAGAGESAVTGAILLGFAIGWTLLAVLSGQRWARVPAGAMGVSGLALVVLAPDAAAIATLGWVWPPLLLALAVWMFTRGQRLLYPVFAILALVAVGGAYETVRDATGGPVPADGSSRLVDVGGHRLAIQCTGSGSPTVVLEPGLGESAAAMGRWIIPAVARTTRICVYDQAGHGRSDAAPDADAARDLHVLLERAHVSGPVVIAGHSLGGMVALSFADRYPAEVAGVVLLDSMHPRQTSVFAGADPVLAVVGTLARTGLARVFFDSKDGDPTTQAQQLVRDIRRMPAEQNQAAKLTTLGHRPLAVVTAGKGSAAGWAANQDELARLSSNRLHRTIAGATHESLIGDETDAAQSSRAIRDIVGAVRGSIQVPAG